MRAGRDVIARWVVSASDWESFMDFDSSRSGSHPNFTSIRMIRTRQDVEIIFGHRSVMVDDRWYKLQGRTGAVFHVAWIEVEPACLEIAILGGADPISFGVIRVPVPQSAVSAGRRVFDHFKAQIPGTAEPPQFLFRYDRAEGAAERYKSGLQSPRPALRHTVPTHVMSGIFFALIGIAIAAVAWYQDSQGSMDRGGAHILIIVGIFTAAVIPATIFLSYIKAGQAN